ncbi:MAG: hypothetical protein V1908_03985 [Candidatus Peregrinibacteria bacterium]
MRAVLAISIPVEKKQEVEQRAKRVQKTTSAYVLNALEVFEQLISEEELLAMSKEAEQNYKMGKTKVLKNLSDLMKE